MATSNIVGFISYYSDGIGTLSDLSFSINLFIFPDILIRYLGKGNLFKMNSSYIDSFPMNEISGS